MKNEKEPRKREQREIENENDKKTRPILDQFQVAVKTGL